MAWFDVDILKNLNAKSMQKIRDTFPFVNVIGIST